MNAPSRRTALTATALVAALVLGGLPTILNDYTTGLCTTALVYAILAVSLDLVWGLTGVIDLGHTIWFGLGCLAVGAATTSIDPSTDLVNGFHTAVSRYLLGTVLGMAIAGAVALALALWVFSFRGGGSLYVVVVTLAASVVAGIVYIQVPSVTGGDNGLFGFNAPALNARTSYWLCAIVLLVVLIGALVFMRSDYGIAMRAVRDNEERAGYLGVNAIAVKSFVFVLGAVVAAVAGGLYATVDGVVSSPLFGFTFATEVLIWVAVGGRGTIVGPAASAFGMALLTSYLNANYSAQWLLIQGALFVIVVLFVPDGVLPAVVDTGRRLLRLPRGAGPSRTLVPGEPTERTELTKPTAPIVTAPGAEARAAVRIRALEVAYGSLRILRGVDLDIRSDELLAIVGPNGAGKSTLLSVLADGRIKARGEISLALESTSRHRGRAPHHLARGGVVRKFQVPELFETLTPAETFVIATHRGRKLSKWRRTVTVPVPAEALEVLRVSGAQGHENRAAADLPHGLKQGMEIALAVALEPSVLLLDEPTAGLTQAERSAIGAVLRRLAAQGIAVVLIEHDLDFVDAVADRIAVLHGGLVIHEGSPETLRESQTVRTAYIGVTE
jgi:branched-chain amino acid transport system permease protein